MKKIILINLLVIMLQSACDNNYKIKNRNSSNFYFEPSISIITGKLKSEVVFGPPNYGENQDTDSKESIYFLQLEKPVSIIPSDSDQVDNVKIENVKSIQLVGIKINTIKSKIGQMITLKGTFSMPISGHHHSVVIFNISN